ncbi:hypothetical protein BTA51_08315 [Hahella sp. CCB-MM4]|uniref:hypothetical protein n=1 Tax=Hahella sp. (strain CCB-MM4) TaxID=1926491 RepID=UPI000B9B18C9|nr:hypothetical protein [Hahella sp. CCB-MM4]OZG73803.1 hypothetical protein BTA51_08315 [Hahella sp. CCB-MM4]
MNSLEIGLNLDSEISETDSNTLACEIIQSNQSETEETITNIAFALYNIAQYRTSGVGYSEMASDLISDWIERVFDEDKKSSEKLADIVFELTSKKSDELVKRLYQKTNDKYLKATLLEALSYKGT